MHGYAWPCKSEGNGRNGHGIGSMWPYPAMQGWRELEVLNVVIKNQTQVRIQPLAGEKSTILQEAKTEQAHVGNYI